jgi:Putative beta-barrel porin 2
MIWPCRIHRARNTVDSLPLALLFAASLLAPFAEAMGQYAAGSTSEEAGVSWFPSVPLQITAGVDIGYDDHVLGGSATTSSSGQGSFFARENLVLSYDRPGGRTEVRLVAVGRFSQFFDAGTDDKNGTVTLSLTHNFSTRLSFRADIYAAYQTEPDFASDVGPENVRADHFDTNDIFSVTYHWLPRVSTVTSYTFERVKYAQATSDTDTASQDRLVNTFAQRLQFSLTGRTNLVGEYRVEIVDYDTAPRDSTTHFALAGIDHSLTEHLKFNVLGGESFRSPENGEDSMNPNVQTTVAYTGSNYSLIWTTSYGFEESNLQNASARTTIRTGVRLTCDLTSRIHSTTAIFYHHDENEGGSSGTSPVGSQDSLRFTLGLRYTINNRFAMHVDYEHTMQSSQGSTQGYSRNQYSAGLSFTY